MPSRDELLDRRLLVCEEPRQLQRPAAHGAEVLGRAHAAAHDHELHRGVLSDELLRGGDELRPALLPPHEPGEADRHAVLGETERPLASTASSGSRTLLCTIVTGSWIAAARCHVSVDRRCVAPALHQRRHWPGRLPRRRRAPSAGARRPGRRCGAPPSGGEERRVVQWTSGNGASGRAARAAAGARAAPPTRGRAPAAGPRKGCPRRARIETSPCGR
jgi:hypothetical protein